MDIEEIGRFAFNEGLKYAEEIAIFTQRINSRLTRFANNEPTISATSNIVVLNLLFKRNGRIIQGSLETISREEIKRHLKLLVQRAALLPRFRDYAELPKGPFKYKKVKGVFDSKILDPEKNIRLANLSIDSALKNGAERVCGSLRSVVTEHYLLTSKNVEAFFRATAATLEVRSIAEEEIKRLSKAFSLKGRVREVSGASSTCGTRLKDLKAKEAGKESAELAKLSKKPVKGKEGRWNVVFGRNAAAVIFGELGRAFSAFLVDANLSCFAGMLGRKVANEDVNICDDGRIEGGIGSMPFDAEGYPTQRTQLIFQEAVKSYLHNSITAKKFKTALTGNAGWLIPLPHNIYVAQGNWKEEELVREIKKGIYVNNLGYLRYQDELKGDFSAVLRDGIFLIEDGEIRTPLTNLRLNANLLEFLKSIEGISKRSIQTYHWWMEARVPVFTPKILVKNLRFTLPTG